MGCTKPNLEAKPGANFKYTAARALLAALGKPLLVHTLNNYTFFKGTQ